MQVWDGVSDARITFSASELPMHSTPEISRLTENLNLQRGLLRHIGQFPEVQLLHKVKVQNIVRDDCEGSAWPLVHLSDGTVIRARLLVSDYVGYIELLLRPNRSVQMDSTRLSGRTPGYSLTDGPMTHMASSRPYSTRRVCLCLDLTR